MRVHLGKILSGASLLAIAMTAAPPAQAQTDDAADAASSEEEIVVTGTSIRGVAPAGAQVLGLGEEQIATTGATSTAQLLANIPQIGVFNTTPTVLGANNFRQSTNRPNVRSLPVGGIAGGSPTLLLMDGHRIVGSGVLQTSPDSDALPPTVIQRVEVVTDGGSAVYGADAVGGVVNYITRNSFDGHQIDTRIGFGDDYQSTDVSLTTGHDWGSGNFFVTYNYLTHDAIYGRDRDYVQDIFYVPGPAPLSLPAGTPRGLVCSPGNVTGGGVTQGIDANGNPQGAINSCDPTDDVSLYPQERKDALFASFTQDLNERFTFDLDAYYLRRVDKSDSGAFGSTVTITPSNFWYNPAFGAGNQSVSFDYSPVAGNSVIAHAITETFGFVPQLTVDLGHDWQLRTLLNYGHSVTATINPGINTAAQTAALAATTQDRALNPYNPALTDPDVLFGNATEGLSGLFNSELYGRGENEMSNAKAVFDGPLFTLPGGEIRVALGAEYIAENYSSVNGTAINADRSAFRVAHDSREATAFFAELNVPIVSPENEIPLVHSLALNLSQRYDDYSDFGSTSNPRIGLTYEPFDWLTFRGTWGESFQAPSLANTAAAAPNVVALLNTTVGGPHPVVGYPVDDPTTPSVNEANYYKLFLSGSATDLRPQTSTSYSIGFDVRPPIVEGLEFSMTYYNIEYRDKIALPPVFSPSFYTDYPTFYLLNPTDAELQAYVAGTANEASILGTLGDTPVYVAYISLQQNLGSTRVDGLDASVNYNHETRFGAIYASAQASYRLNIEDSPGPGLPYGSNYAGLNTDGSRTTATARLGALWGENLRTQATVNYTGPVTYPLTAAGQTRVDAFYTLNLYAQYDFEGEGLRNGLSLSLGIDNVTDEDPSFYSGDADPNRHGWANGATLGRVFQVGLSKHF